MVTPQGSLLCAIHGPVHAPISQTAPAAEYSSLAMAALQIVARSEVFSDCLAVVNHFLLPPSERLSYRRRYSGMFLYINGSPHIPAAFKVKAHLDQNEVGIADEERFRRSGNNFADQAAQRGARARPSAAPADVDRVDRCVKISKIVCLLAAKLLPAWPRLISTKWRW